MPVQPLLRPPVSMQTSFICRHPFCVLSCHRCAVAAVRCRSYVPAVVQNSTTELPLEQAIDLVKDAFVSAGERDIYTVSAFVAGGLGAEARGMGVNG